MSRSSTGWALSFSAIFVWSIRTDERRHTPLPASAALTALARCSIGSVSYVVAIGLALGSAAATLVVTGRGRRV
jgi:hypothetical protein